MVYAFYMSAASYSNIASLYIESFGIQLNGKESCLVGYHTAGTITRDNALSVVLN